MRILMFAPNYLPATRYGGPVRSAHGLARGLVAQGHSVVVLTTDVDGPERLDIPLDRPVEMDGVQIHYCPIAAPRRLYYSPALARLADRLVPSVDAVHVNGMFLWPGPYIAGLARRGGVPLVISPRGMLVPEMINGKSRLAKRLWIALRERSALASARAIHATSEEEADGIRRLRLDVAPIRVVGNGVDGPDVKPSDEAIEVAWRGIAPNQRCLFLGRLDWTKGVDIAIAALAKLKGNASLILAGPDQIGLRKKLEPQIPIIGGAPVAQFIGPVDGAEKWALLAGADIVLVPSVKESFGMTVAEALFVGTPVICTPGVGAAHIVRRLDSGAVVERDANALAAEIDRMLADNDRRRRYGAAAEAKMRADYGWKTIAGQMAELYCAGGSA